MKKLLIIVFLFCLANCLAEPGLHIYYLDVGQGDATVILCDDQVMMIDGGDATWSQFIYSFLRNTLGIDNIDVMIATHPHADHVGGLAAALNACSVGVLYTSELDYDTKSWQSVLKYAEAQGTPVIIPYPGDEFDLGGAVVQIVGPLWYHNNLNDLSLIIRLIYGDSVFLFMADAEIEAEMDLVDAGIDISADVLRVGHHGSDTSSCQPFLDAVDADIAVISVGKENKYGHPNEDVLERLKGKMVYRTDLDGTVECFSDGETIWFERENSASREVFGIGH